MKKTIIVITSILALAVAQSALANDDTKRMHGVHYHGPLHGDKDAKQMSTMKEHGDHAEHMQGEMSPMKKDMFLIKQNIDGFSVSFHVMKVDKDMQHGGTHNVLIKIEKSNVVLSGLTINSKVTHPNGQSESKMLMEMGDWYMAGYDLGHEGQHQLMVLFKTSDGKKHFGGINYPDKK